MEDAIWLGKLVFLHSDRSLSRSIIITTTVQSLYRGFPHPSCTSTTVISLQISHGSNLSVCCESHHLFQVQLQVPSNFTYRNVILYLPDRAIARYGMPTPTWSPSSSTGSVVRLRILWVHAYLTSPFMKSSFNNYFLHESMQIINISIAFIFFRFRPRWLIYPILSYPIQVELVKIF